jgi:hypothetical protein
MPVDLEETSPISRALAGHFLLLLLLLSRLVPCKHSISHLDLPHVIFLLLQWAFEDILEVDIRPVEEVMYNISDRNGSGGTKNDKEDNEPLS